MTEPTKTRLDQHVVSLGLAESRSQAQAMIKAGRITSNGETLMKASLLVASDVAIDSLEKEHPWVSRGGMKLAHAVEHFSLASDIKDATCLDIGASTGGFTSVLLHHGAKIVYAVDVGTGQLHGTLKTDARVISLESTNAKTLSCDIIQDSPSIIVCDASFIALHKVLPAALSLATTPANLITLIKPQFEVGKDIADKHKGVIKSEKMHQKVCEKVGEWMKEQGWQVSEIIESPIVGPKGNKEFLLHARKA